MFKNNETFSSYSVNDLEKAKRFYSEVLGVKIIQTPEGLSIKLAGQKELFLYSKPDHQPATFTVLNFLVNDIEKAVSELKKKDVKFEQYQNPKTDEDGIARVPPGPIIAWFKDPAGNILSVVQENR